MSLLVERIFGMVVIATDLATPKSDVLRYMAMTRAKSVMILVRVQRWAGISPSGGLQDSRTHGLSFTSIKIEFGLPSGDRTHDLRIKGSVLRK